MQDDCLDVSNKPFYKRRKKLIPPPRGASFRVKKITLMLTWRLYQATPSDILVSGPPPASDFILGFLSPAHVQNDHVVQNKCDNDIHLQNKVKP